MADLKLSKADMGTHLIGHLKPGQLAVITDSKAACLKGQIVFQSMGTAVYLLSTGTVVKNSSLECEVLTKGDRITVNG